MNQSEEIIIKQVISKLSDYLAKSLTKRIERLKKRISNNKKEFYYLKYYFQSIERKFLFLTNKDFESVYKDKIETVLDLVKQNLLTIDDIERKMEVEQLTNEDVLKFDLKIGHKHSRSVEKIVKIYNPLQREYSQNKHQR